MASQSSAEPSFQELEKVRKALKHARITRDRVPKNDAERRQRAEDKVAALEAQRDDLYAKLGRQTPGKLEDAQRDHNKAAELVRKALAMAAHFLSLMEGCSSRYHLACCNVYQHC